MRRVHFVQLKGGRIEHICVEREKGREKSEGRRGEREKEEGAKRGESWV